MSSTVDIFLLQNACNLANRFDGCQLRIDAPNNDEGTEVWTLDLVNDEGECEEYDVVIKDKDLNIALNKFVSKANKEIDEDPMSSDDEDGLDDDED